MHVNEISRQQFSKLASRGLRGRMVLTEQGLVLGAGTLLAKLDGKALQIEAQERIWTLLSVAYGEEISQAVFGSLRRVAKHWRSGDKCLAAIHLAQTGLPDIGEDAADRLSLAAELIDAGVAPRELARELGLNPNPITKYWEEEPRVPAGSGRGSGEWEVADGSGSTVPEGRSVSVRPRGAQTDRVHTVPGLPKNAVVVTRPDGTTIDDRESPTKKLMAPPRANFQEVYAAGEKIASKPYSEQINEAGAALGHFGTYDFQRDKATNSFFDEYVPAANYAIGVYMAGAGYNLVTTYAIAEGYAMGHSSNWYKYWSRGKPWIASGWEDGRAGYWKMK